MNYLKDLFSQPRDGVMKLVKRGLTVCEKGVLTILVMMVAQMIYMHSLNEIVQPKLSPVTQAVALVFMFLSLLAVIVTTLLLFMQLAQEVLKAIRSIPNKRKAKLISITHRRRIVLMLIIRILAIVLVYQTYRFASTPYKDFVNSPETKAKLNAVSDLPLSKNGKVK